MYMCVYVYMYMYVCMCIYIYIYIYISAAVWWLAFPPVTRKTWITTERL